MKFLVGIPVPRGLLPAGDFETVSVRESWMALPDGSVVHRVQIGDQEPQFTYWPGQMPFVLLSLEDLWQEMH